MHKEDEHFSSVHFHLTFCSPDFDFFIPHLVAILDADGLSFSRSICKDLLGLIFVMYLQSIDTHIHTHQQICSIVKRVGTCDANEKNRMKLNTNSETTANTSSC